MMDTSGVTRSPGSPTGPRDEPIRSFATAEQSGLGVEGPASDTDTDSEEDLWESAARLELSGRSHAHGQSAAEREPWPAPPARTADATQPPRPSGEEYRGATENGTRSGFGTLSVNGRWVYRGHWLDGLYHGQGEERRGDSSYSGGWLRGLRQGAGTETTSTDTYTGEWVDGRRHGEGASEGAGHAYRGSWRLGFRHGSGSATFPGGEVYDGAWQNGKRHGEGEARTAAGTYRGAWERGERHGHGSETLADGSTYVGAWQEGHRHGQGRETLASGTTFEGQWERGRRHGLGREWQDGRVTFEGSWRVGQRHGRGIETWTGDHREPGQELSARGAGCYEGQWAADKRHGIGRWRGALPSGKAFVCDGQWEDDRFVAPDRQSRTYIRRY